MLGDEAIASAFDQIVSKLKRQPLICHRSQIGLSIGSGLGKRGEVGGILGIGEEGAGAAARLECRRVLLARSSDLLLQHRALCVGEF